MYVKIKYLNKISNSKMTVLNSKLKIVSEMPGEIVFNTMRYRSSETVQRLGYFQKCQLYKAPNNV